MRTILSLFVVLLFAISCGGGSGDEVSGGGVSPDSNPVPPEMPEPTPPAPRPEEPDPYCYTTDQETIIEFLEETVEGRVERWNRSPVVRVVSGATRKQREIVGQSIGWLNLALPKKYDIDIEADVQEGSSSSVGEIHIEYTPEINAVGSTWTNPDPAFEGAIGSSLIRIQAGTAFSLIGDCEKVQLWIITHELLHALGFSDHVDMRRWGRDSLVSENPGGSAAPSCSLRGLDEIDLPRPLDQDALRALYTLEIGDYPAELRIESEEECVE